MNIHFDDRELFEKLKSATLAKVRVGSHMYGNNNENSDEDFLYIYATSFNEVNSFISTHHQLQFKENNIDYNFVSLHTFIKNILNGDSTINFEVIQSDVLDNTDLEWLVKHRHSFVTYSVIRSYLGLSRRDIKHYHKANTEYDKKKKLGHIWRGYMYANNMIHHTWNFKNVNEQFCKKYDLLDVSNNKSLRDVESGISFMRDLLNEKFGDKTLGYAQHMKVEDATLLMDNFLKFCKTDIFVNKQNILQDFDMSRFVNSFENWVEY